MLTILIYMDQFKRNYLRYSKLIIIIFLWLCFSSDLLAAINGYPPYSFKSGPFKHLQAKHPISTSPFVKEDLEMFDAFVADLDNNGLNDYLVFYTYRGCGLGALSNYVELYLKQKNGKYRFISYNTMSAGLDDFVDFNGDGKYEIIITDVLMSGGHTYFSYHLYAIKDYKLVNVDAKYTAFPKYVWFTMQPNDKPARKVLLKDAKESLMESEKSFEYNEVEIKYGF